MIVVGSILTFYCWLSDPIHLGCTHTCSLVHSEVTEKFREVKVVGLVVETEAHVGRGGQQNAT